MKIFTRTDGATTKKTLEIFRQEIAHDRKAFIVGMTTVPLSYFLYIVLLPLLISFVIQILIEQPSDTTTLLWLIASMVIVSILAIISNQIGYGVMFKHEERVVSRLVERALSALMKHSQSYFSNQKVGSLAGDVNNFSRSYLTFMDTVLMQFMGIAVSYVASLVVIGFIAPLLLIPLGILTTFVIIHSGLSMQQRAPYRNKRKELQSKLLGQLADILGNQMLVRLFGRTDDEITSVLKDRQEIVDIASQEIDLIQANAKIRQIVLFSFQIITIGLIIWLFQNDAIAIGAVIFAITYLGRVTSTMFNITAIIRGIEQSFIDAAKITEMLQLHPEVTDRSDAQELQVSRAVVDIQQVDFAYSDAKHEAVFDNLNLLIESGQKIGLVGRSGGGKTTLTSLLLRYADINSGQILIDGQDIADVTQSSLRSAISYVPQDPYLFHRTLRENIAYGRPDATDDEIIKAATQANAISYIDKLPLGLDTTVGERGVKLSGGQRQRIAIARAILKDAPILILDEATSALDSESEKLIQASLDELMKNRTSIVIAHRLSTIAKLDRIVVLDEGRIIEEGTHHELLKLKGAYASLWRHQSGGFIED